MLTYTISEQTHLSKFAISNQIISFQFEAVYKNFHLAPYLPKVSNLEVMFLILHADQLQMKILLFHFTVLKLQDISAVIGHNSIELIKKVTEKQLNQQQPELKMWLTIARAQVTVPYLNLNFNLAYVLVATEGFYHSQLVL